MLLTSLVLPFQTSSTSRLSSKSRKTKPVWQRPVRFQVADDFLLLLLG